MSQYFAGSIQPGRTFLFLDFSEGDKIFKNFKIWGKGFF